jgi:hypothetical protein
MIAMNQKEIVDSQRLSPSIACPRCCTPMWLSTIEPEQRAGRNTLTFICSCGFEYKTSSAVGEERTLALGQRIVAAA